MQGAPSSEIIIFLLNFLKFSTIYINKILQRKISDSFEHDFR